VIWVEQDLSPNAVVQASRAAVPMAMVNARMNAAAFARRRNVKSLFSEVLSKFDFISAQYANSAQNLTAIGERDVKVFPSLEVNLKDLALHNTQIDGRKVWLLASSWQPDEEIALMAHSQLLQNDPTALLIIAPRDISRSGDIANAAAHSGLRRACKSAAPAITPETQVYIADSFGEMGLWYRLCRTALIGGSFGPTEGHNPWEAAVLGCAILHGPRTGNFTNDYAQLDAADAAISVEDAKDVFAALKGDHSDMAARAQGLTAAAKDNLAPLAAQLLALMR
jgi:3-deoxy-D-manno-octulosonic-acid transferase